MTTTASFSDSDALFFVIPACAENFFTYLVASLRYAIKSARSSGFLRPANTIFVPGMYFFGFKR